MAKGEKQEDSKKPHSQQSTRLQTTFQSPLSQLLTTPLLAADMKRSDDESLDSTDAFLSREEELTQASAEIDCHWALKWLQANPQYRLSQSQMTPFLVDAIQKNDVVSFEALLNSGLKCAYNATHKQQSITEFAYLTTFHEGKNLFRLAVELRRVEILECLLRHSYFQGIPITSRFRRESPIEKDLYAILWVMCPDGTYNPPLDALWREIFSPQESLTRQNIRGLLSSFDLLQDLANGLHDAVSGTHQYGSSVRGVVNLTGSNHSSCVSKIRAICPQTPLTSDASVLQAPKSNATKPNAWFTPMDRAISLGQLDSVKLLHKNGVSLKHHPTSRVSPLYLAVFYGKNEIAKWLVENNVPYELSAFNLAGEKAKADPTNSQRAQILELMQTLHQPLFKAKFAALVEATYLRPANAETLGANDRLVFPKADAKTLRKDNGVMFPKNTKREDKTVSPFALLQPGTTQDPTSPGLGTALLYEIGRFLAYTPKTTATAAPTPRFSVTPAPAGTMSEASSSTLPAREAKKRKLPTATQTALSSNSAADNINILKNKQLESDTVSDTELLTAVRNLYIIAQDSLDPEEHELIRENAALIHKVFTGFQKQGHFSGDFPFPEKPAMLSLSYM